MSMPGWSATPDYELLPGMPRKKERVGYRGGTGVETYVGDITETWEEYRLVPDEFRDLGERVLMLGRIEVRGKGSGTPVDAPFGAISEFRDGKVLRLRGFLDH